MNETRRKPTNGRQSPSLFDKLQGIFYMPSRVHTKAFDYPVAEHRGGDRNVQPREDSNRQHIGSHSKAPYPLKLPAGQRKKNPPVQNQEKLKKKKKLPPASVPASRCNPTYWIEPAASPACSRFKKVAAPGASVDIPRTPVDSPVSTEAPGRPI